VRRGPDFDGDAAAQAPGRDEPDGRFELFVDSIFRKTGSEREILRKIQNASTASRRETAPKQAEFADFLRNPPF
jgi:hypothetical protein